MKVIIPYMACSLSLPYYIGDTIVVERERERDRQRESTGSVLSVVVFPLRYSVLLF